MAALRHDGAVDETPDALTLRLVRVAADLALPGLGPRVEQAVSLAVDLVVADRDTPATLTVASLGRGATLRDSGEDIRSMLREQGVVPPTPPAGEDPAYVTALWAVGLGGLGVGEFSVVFYNFLPSWNEQSDAQRRIAVLLKDWDSESDLAAREPLTAEIQRLAAAASGTDFD